MTHENAKVLADNERGSLLPWYQRTVRREAVRWLARRKRHLSATERIKSFEAYIDRTQDDFWRQLFGDTPGKVLAKLFPIGLILYLVYAAGAPERDFTKFAASLAQYIGIYLVGGIITVGAFYFAHGRKRTEAWEEELKSKIGRLETAVTIWDEAQAAGSGVDPLTTRWAFIELEQAVEAAKRGPAA